MSEPLAAHFNVLLEGSSMPKVPEIIPVDDLRHDAAGVLRRVRTSTQPIVITQRGRAAAIILSVGAYKRAERERHLLRLLARGEMEITTDPGYDLNEVLDAADALLARAPK